MNKFRQIIILETIATAEQLIEKLSKYSENEIKYFDSVAKDDDEIINRIGDADCLLVTWASKISHRVLEATDLRYIGLCASLYTGKNSNIDLEAAEQKGIVVKGISDYGDFGTVEFIISETINYFKKGPNRELKGKKIGIIGMGSVGRKLVNTLKFFDATIYYYNRSRKKDLEKDGVIYLTKEELLNTAEVLILCLPRNSSVLTEDDFKKLKSNVLINISMGTPFDLNPFYKWVGQTGKSAVFDQVSIGDITSGKNIIIKDYVSGFTEEAKVRQVQKVEENIIEFFKKP